MLSFSICNIINSLFEGEDIWGRDIIYLVSISIYPQSKWFVVINQLKNVSPSFLGIYISLDNYKGNLVSMYSNHLT